MLVGDPELTQQALGVSLDLSSSPVRMAPVLNFSGVMKFAMGFRSADSCGVAFRL